VRRVILGALSLLLPLAACEGMRSLLTLQQGLATEFQWSQVGVNVANGTRLTVTFQNAPFGNATREARDSICRQAAEYVRDHYPGYPTLSEVAVSFASRKDYGPVNLTHSETPCNYSARELGRGRAAKTAGSP
jgi:hypothetical protein